MFDLTIFYQITVGMALVMSIGWLYQRFSNRAEIVDVLWTFGTGAAGVWCAVTLDGDPGRRLILGAVIFVWSLRLGIHLVRDRVFTSEEDGRYRDLRESWGSQAHTKFFVFFQIQALLVAFLASAFYSVARNSMPLSYLDFVALFLFIVSLIGESAADAQLRNFRLKSQDRKSICTDGLWRYSRHPNYFFEWLHWLVYPLMAWTGEYWMLSLVSPLLMYYLVRYVTGVPIAEERMLKSRGELFREYRARTSEFWPWMRSI